uniref:Uncharacterized protein n=1 Tax=Romanomermis culicivorax TaxID=13658 RepID=A0A915J2S7_ROMCU
MPVSKCTCSNVQSCDALADMFRLLICLSDYYAVRIENYGLALVYLNECRRLCERSQFKLILALVLRRFSYIELKTNALEPALKDIESSARLLRITGYLVELGKTLLFKSKCMEEIHKSDNDKLGGEFNDSDIEHGLLESNSLFAQSSAPYLEKESAINLLMPVESAFQQGQSTNRSVMSSGSTKKRLKLYRSRSNADSDALWQRLRLFESNQIDPETFDDLITPENRYYDKFGLDNRYRPVLADPILKASYESNQQKITEHTALKQHQLAISKLQERDKDNIPQQFNKIQKQKELEDKGQNAVIMRMI